MLLRRARDAWCSSAVVRSTGKFWSVFAPASASLASLGVDRPSSPRSMPSPPLAKMRVAQDAVAGGRRPTTATPVVAVEGDDVGLAGGGAADDVTSVALTDEHAVAAVAEVAGAGLGRCRSGCPARGLPSAPTEEDAVVVVAGDQVARRRRRAADLGAGGAVDEDAVAVAAGGGAGGVGAEEAAVDRGPPSPRPRSRCRRRRSG